MSTIELVRLRDLDFGTEIRDAAFVDDDRLLVATREGDGRLAEVESGRLSPTPVWLYRDLRSQTLRSIGAAEDAKLPEPVVAPRVAASARSGTAVVNNEHVNLFAVPLEGSAAPRMLVAGWGQYGPTLRFSADGSHVAMQADGLYVTDLRARKTVEYAMDASDWHPTENRMLVLDETQLGWIEGGPVDYRPVGRIDLPETRHDPAGLAVSADCAECVVAFYQDRLEWWSIDGEPRLLEVRRTYDGPERRDGIDHVVPSPDRLLLAVISSAGMRTWDVRTREPIGPTVAGVSYASFAPSGRRLLTIEFHPRGEGRPSWPDVLATLWEVRG